MRKFNEITQNQPNMDFVYHFMCVGLSFVKLHFMYLWMDTPLVRIKLKAERDENVGQTKLNCDTHTARRLQTKCNKYEIRLVM